jgi:hypothetical protein
VLGLCGPFLLERRRVDDLVVGYGVLVPSCEFVELALVASVERGRTTALLEMSRFASITIFNDCLLSRARRRSNGVRRRGRSRRGPQPPSGRGNRGPPTPPGAAPMRRLPSLPPDHPPRRRKSDEARPASPNLDPESGRKHDCISFPANHHQCDDGGGGGGQRRRRGRRKTSPLLPPRHYHLLAMSLPTRGSALCSLKGGPVEKCPASRLFCRPPNGRCAYR